jgi:hypothetical protein
MYAKNTPKANQFLIVLPHSLTSVENRSDVGKQQKEK